LLSFLLWFLGLKIRRKQIAMTNVRRGIRITPLAGDALQASHTLAGLYRVPWIRVTASEETGNGIAGRKQKTRADFAPGGGWFAASLLDESAGEIAII
jgi:hypothetical protein